MGTAGTDHSWRGVQKISLGKCRALLGDNGSVSDVELEQIRDELYALADILVSAYLEQKIESTNGKKDSQELTDVPVEKAKVEKRSSVKRARMSIRDEQGHHILPGVV